MATQFLSSSSRVRWDYDVFLSFRGEDTRQNFTDHLYNALDRVGIRTFRDNEEIRRGKTISTELPKAIHKSRISIVVFSEAYASSTWCLDELAEIVDCCRNNNDHTLYPIFYHVKPSDVRKQTGNFAEAFTKHERQFQTEMERARVKRWRGALTEAADFSGWDLSSFADGYESRFIEKIVDEVLCVVNPTRLSVAKNPIGIESPVEKVKALLSIGKSNVRVIGIYGLGGIGKTEIAKTVYNSISYAFEGSSCLLDIKETSEEFNGLVKLQKKLLHDILKKNFMIDHSDEGITLIEERLHCKRVLVVLDDVNNLEKLYDLLGDLRCFGSGSRLIITTRYEDLLTQLGVDDKYKVKTLNDSLSLELFSRHAFNLDHPRLGYQELSVNAVNYTGGLPLGLKVLGSFLKEKSVVEWKSELKKLERKSHDGIQKVLQISFDSLDPFTKDMFLDIACFFIGINKEYALKIFEGCSFFPDSGIKILEQRSLVIIDYQNKLRMHSLIQHMGREIVRGRALNILGKYSRLWSQEDALSVLGKHTGSEVVEGLSLHLPVPEDMLLTTEAFANMTNLRLLRMNVVHLTGCFKHISKELRWLYWHRCPLKCLPQDFHLKNLIILDMQQSKLVKVWESYKILKSLKVLNLSHSEYLTKSPNFLGVPQLEELILEGCTRLAELHESIGCLGKLLLLNLRGCVRLRYLPSSISNLGSLKTLEMPYCLRLDKLPKQKRNMLTSTVFDANGTVIGQLVSFDLLENRNMLISTVFDANGTVIAQHFSFDPWENRNIELSEYKRELANSCSSCLSSWISPKISSRINLLPASICGLRSLQELNLSYCDLSEDEFPVDLGSLSSLTILKLSGNNFRTLPHSVKSLPNLVDLEIDRCRDLQSISGVPASLYLLYAEGCTSLKRLPDFSDMKHSVIFSLHKCHNLVDKENLRSLRSLFTVMEALVSPGFFLHLLSNRGVQFHTIFLLSCEIPRWVRHQAEGSSISFRVPSLLEGEFRGLLVWASYQETSYAPNSTSIAEPLVGVSMYNKTRGFYQFLFTEAFTTAARCLAYKIPVITKSIGECRQYFLPEICYIPPRLWRSSYVHCPEVIRKGMEVGSGDEIEMSIEFHGDTEVHRCGIHELVFAQNALDDYEMGRVSEVYGLTDDEFTEVMLLQRMRSWKTMPKLRLCR